MSLLDQSLGQIATSVAGATAVFHQYKLDFCCGGQLSLREALAKRQLPADACNTWTALYVGLKELKEDLMQHIMLENHILFVQPTHAAKDDDHQLCCGSCQ